MIETLQVADADKEDVRLKRCSHCGQWKPIGEFYKDKSQKDGLYYTCKDCIRERNGQKKKEEVRKVIDGVLYKKCCCCKQWKPITEFHKDSSNKDGLHCECKACCKQYREQHRKEARERKRRYYERNKEKCREMGRKSYEKHREKRKERAKEYREMHKEERKEYNKKYREEHKEERRQYYKEHKEKNIYLWWAKKVIRHHKDRNNNIYITSEELERLARKVKFCPLCNVELSYNNAKSSNNTASLDRLNNENDIRADNIAIICRKCNTIKNDKKIGEFFEYCKYIASHETEISDALLKQKEILTNESI